jgi:hypothetical protein
MSQKKQQHELWWQDDGQLGSALKDLAASRKNSDLEKAVFSRTMASLPERPAGWRKTVFRWWESITERPLAAVATVAVAVLIAIGVWVAVATMQTPRPVETNPNMAQIENIESVNSTAIVADGNNDVPTVIWVFEE